MPVYLQTERLILRTFTPDDVDLAAALDADPAVMRYINGGRPTPRDEIRDIYLPSWIAHDQAGDRYGFWAAVEKRTGGFLGWFHLRPRDGDPDDEPELGYRLFASAWGRGYATEGSRALIRSAFEELGARRVYATTLVVNVASRRVMEKAGLRFMRVFQEPWPDPIDGEEHDFVEYALTRDDWEADRTQRPDA